VLVLAQPEMVLKDEFFQTIYWQLRTHLAARGLPLQVAAPPPRDTVEWMLGLGAAPLIAIATPRYAYDDLREVARRGLPTVAIASDVQGFGLYSVDADNLMGAALAVRHLSSLGHKRVAFVGGYPEESNSLDRERGYQTACNAAGLDADPRLSFMFPTDSFASSPETEARLRSALASKDRPTELFAAGPRLAMQALRTAADLGLRVPETCPSSPSTILPTSRSPCRRSPPSASRSTRWPPASPNWWPARRFPPPEGADFSRRSWWSARPPPLPRPNPEPHRT